MEHITIAQILSFFGLTGASCLALVKLFFHPYLKEEIQKNITPNLVEIDNKIKEIENTKVCKDYCLLTHRTSEDRHNELITALRDIQNLLMNQNNNRGR